MGAGGSAPQTNTAEMMRQQEQMMNRQMKMQLKFQQEAEDRLRQERERERQSELARRQSMAAEKEQTRVTEERREASLFREMTGQTSQEDSSDFGGGFNLDMPTIERPDYEQTDRPE